MCCAANLRSKSIHLDSMYSDLLQTHEKLLKDFKASQKVKSIALTKLDYCEHKISILTEEISF